MSTFNIRNFSDQNNSQIVKDLQTNSDLVYAEDLVISLAQQIGINPIGRHLFGLYHSKNKIWLSNNELLSEWTESKDFEFRLRYRPNSWFPNNSNNFKIIDQNAFHYYFHQIRYDFINGKFENENIVYGLAVTDILRETLKRNIQLEAALDSIDLSGFLPQSFKKKFFLVKTKVRDALCKAYNNTRRDINFVEQKYMDLFITSLDPSYGIESYDVMFNNRLSANRQHLIQVKVQYNHYCYDENGINGIVIKSIHDTKNDWTKVCSISDIGFISVNSQKKAVEISRTSGVPFNFTFKHDLDMKSFVSLLDGYYRLSVKWSFNICKDISSPSLAKLRKIKCHGPVGNDFAYNKLKEKANNNSGAYILRESMSKYNEFKLDVLIRHEHFETFKIKIIKNQVYVEGLDKYYESFADMIKNFMTFNHSGEAIISLSHCITPSEHDQPLNLLICRPNTQTNTTKTNTESLGPPIIPTNCLKLSNTTLTNNSRYGVRLATLQNKQFIVKEVKSLDMTQEFLKTVSQWSHLRNDSIVICKGVTLYSPLSIVLEYYPIGPLDTFLMTNKQNLKLDDLIETVSYLARALWFLHENSIVHGHIRCHNLLVSEYSSNCLKVRLSDPISDNDINQERVWLPPEYFSTRDICYSFKRLTHSVDVWSFGTTVWQIFSYGTKPNCDDIIELTKPTDCPNEIWSLIRECWTIDCEARKQPHSIVRDISQIMYEVQNSRRIDHYSQPIFDDKKPNKSSVSKIFSKYKQNSIFGSTSSIASSSIMSMQSTSTYLSNSIKGNETTIGSQLCLISDLNGYDVNNNVNSNPEPWLIEPHQVILEKVIGTGCYGEVWKATLILCAGLKEELVAVKRIKAVPSETLLRDMIREIEIMKKLSHENIVEIKGFIGDSTDLTNLQTELVMEFVELGSLVTYLRINKSNKSSLPLTKFASDISLGMEYLESKSVVHRDLAARNILVASQNHVKISDFGLACYTDPDKEYYALKTIRKLPLAWYAPESLKYYRFSHKSDIWSYGILLWEMYSFGENPQLSGDLSGEALLEALEKGIRLHCPDDCPRQVYQIMGSCWQNDDKLRPSFTELNHLIEEIAQ